MGDQRLRNRDDASSFGPASSKSALSTPPPQLYRASTPRPPAPCAKAPLEVWRIRGSKVETAKSVFWRRLRASAEYILARYLRAVRTYPMFWPLMDHPTAVQAMVEQAIPKIGKCKEKTTERKRNGRALTLMGRIRVAGKGQGGCRYLVRGRQCSSFTRSFRAQASARTGLLSIRDTKLMLHKQDWQTKGYWYQSE